MYNLIFDSVFTPCEYFDDYILIIALTFTQNVQNEIYSEFSLLGISFCLCT